MHIRTLLSLGLLSASIIAFQLVLIQFLSIVQWHHFAYMIISVAMLGFGAAGTVLAISRYRILKNFHFLLPLLMIGCGLTMSLVTELSQLSFARFDSYLLFANYTHMGRLLITYLLFFIPFFLSALAIGIIFDNYIKGIGKIYFANMLGSGAGGLLALAGLWFFFPNQLTAMVSVLPILAGIIIIAPGKDTGHRRIQTSFLISFAIIALTICAWKIIDPTHLQPSQFKDLRKTMLLPDAEIKMEKTSPYGVLHAVTSPVLRYGPGLSLTTQQVAGVKAAVFNNGDWLGAVNGGKYDSTFILRSSGFELPYIMAEREQVLVLHPGTGMDIVHALSHKAKFIQAVESNSFLSSALKHELAPLNDSIFYHPGISIRELEPRTFLLTDTAHYDLIVLPGIGSFGGSAGLFALREQFLLTKESFLGMWPRLKDGGAITVTAWMDYPARNPLKLMATAIEMLEELKITQPRNHIAAVRSWSTISFVITKSALTNPEIVNIRNFCEQMQFDPVFLPGLREEERINYHKLQDSSFLDNMNKLLTVDRKILYDRYDFNIIPATDNRPYFSQFIRWKSLPMLSKKFGNRAIPFFEIGYLLVVVTLLQIAIISFVLILLPLFKLGWKGKNKFRVLLYFSSIGLGYMFVEMVFIQRFILYFGQPVYAASAVITSLLIFSGFGSYVSAYFTGRRNGLQLILAVIVLLLSIYAFALTPILLKTIGGGLSLKLLIVILLIAPLGFCMGIPFPAGLARVSQINSKEIPWAWGLNGCFSIISTVLATIIAVELGSAMVLLLAALAYCVPLILWRKSASAD
jgi:hypothetical protein